MAESVRKRTSKWDLVPETHFPIETVEENAPSGNTGSICNEKESNPGLVSSETHIAGLPGTEANDVMRAKDSSGGSCWEPLPRSEDERKDGNIDRNRKEISLAEDKWGGDQSYSARMSPGLDAWRQRRSSPSPRRWNKSRRSRSRSRSRSRTPSYGFKRRREDWSSRGRSGTGRTTVACRDFAKGRCRRGSQCRYLHQDSHDYEDRRHYDRGPAENRGSRQDRGGSPGYVGDGAYIDSQERNSCPQDKLSHYIGSHYDVDREKHDSRKNRRSSVLCNDFLKGKCYRGSACKYVHHGDSADGYGGWPSKEGSREGAAHDRGSTGSSFGHDHRREGGRSNTLCKYFAEGHCHKGEYCRFSHQDPVHGGPEGRSRDDRWSHSRGGEDRSWDGPRWGVEASNGNLRNSPSLCGPENRPWDGSNKVSNGNVCNPPHLEGPESSSWNGPKLSGKTSGKNLANSDTGAISFPENKPWEAPTLGGGNMTDKTISDPSQWKSDKNSARGDEPGFPEPRNAENVFSSTGVCPARENRGGLPPDMATQEPIRNPQNLHSSNSEEEIKHQFLPKEVPDINLPATYEQNTTEVSGGEPQCASTVLLQQTLPESTYIQQHPGLRVDALALSPFEGKNKVSNSANPPNEINFSNKMPAVVSMPEQCFSEIKQSQQLVPASLPSVAQGSIPSVQSQWGVLSPPNSQDFNPNVQTQQIVHPSSNKQNYYLSGHSQQTVITPLSAQNFNSNENNSPLMVPQPPSGVQPQANGNNGQQMIPHPPSGTQLQAFPGHEESVRRPESQDVSMSSMPCETPTARNIVTSEQLSKITDLSASLQQIFGNGSQLPQLYASLNHLSAAGLVPSLPHSLPNTVQPPPPMTVPSIQPNQQAWPQNQCDPVHDKMEFLNPDINDQPPGFSTNLFEQKSATIEESRAPSKSSAPSSASSGPNDGNDQKCGDSVGKMHEENQVFSQLDVSKEVNEEMNGQYNKEQETGHLKDMDAGDGQCDEDSKRSKETKGMRMFRFALVEFVKELLKPTWKEGHMSKEAYKTIVKKVIDKVTGALQGPNLPQTQEKIDHYLSYSKPKLTKLVQAYVDKYVKS